VVQRSKGRLPLDLRRDRVRSSCGQLLHTGMFCARVRRWLLRRLLLTIDQETLTYGCICSDHTQPNLSEYSMTIPFHLCQQWGNNCVKDCGAWDNECSNKCREENLCGAQDPKKPNTSTTATSEPTATPSSDPDQVFNGISGATDGATNNGNSGSGAAALHFGQAYGLVVVLTSLFAGFAIML